MQTDKIVTLKELQEKLQGSKNICISSCSGSFDILHHGHISYLTEAKSYGDILVVFLNTDNSIALYKGPTRPILDFYNRSLLLASLECVDYIIPLDELTPLNILEILQPAIFCNGADWGSAPVEKSTIEEYGGKFITVSPQTRNSISTSDIIKKIQTLPIQQDVKSLFLDRDGVLIVDTGYVYTIENVTMLPETISGLQKLRDDGWDFYVITNQSGIGRGMYSVEDMHTVHKHIDILLAKANIHIKKYYYCPHTPFDLCNCRKPMIGLFEQAAKEFNIPLSKSWMIGDKLSDVEAGRRSNMKTILIGDTGKNQFNSLTTPDAFALNLNEAADFIQNIH